MALLNRKRHRRTHAGRRGLARYTLATLPAPSENNVSALVYVTDATPAASVAGSPAGSPAVLGTVAFSNGAVWVDVTTGAPVA